MKLLAYLSFIVAWHMQLVLDLVFAMSKGAGISEFAFSKSDPVLAELGLELHLVPLDEALSFRLVSELSVGFSRDCHVGLNIPVRTRTGTLGVLFITRHSDVGMAT